MQFEDRDAIDQNQEFKGLAEDGRGVAVQARTVTYPLSHNPHTFEDFEGLAQRRPADAELDGEIAFCRQSLARFESAGSQQILETGNQLASDKPGGLAAFLLAARVDAAVVRPIMDSIT